MGALLNFDNTSRPLVGINPDFEHGTPLDLLKEGDVEMADSFVEWMQAPAQKDELYDMLLSNSPGMTLPSLRETWSKAVLKGEWS
ncbi:hypothetical protein [Vreelandella populi]|uniref:hypothetical protein n=1 Tax=Vreelandella populi TaxID=2498858 RepID=UPI000F8F6F17|nr:hypothetical protein [Halomonas populi]RUR52736.1 hypothetical protein ELY40_11850 [Halomonas populi]